MRKVLPALMIGIGLALSSCAYVQTHKNVEEIGSYYEGGVLDAKTMGLYKRGGVWYLSAYKAQFKLSYPVVHDSVFRRNDFSPEFRLMDTPGREVIYHPISASAADVLLSGDGYFQLRALSDEIHRTPGEWTTDLAGAQKYPILAEIGGKQIYYMEEKRVPANKPLVSKILGKLDFVIVDIPSTIVYNVAIPVMAPFVFFYEFTHED